MVLKKRVGVIFGGNNVEHEVSVRSAVSIMQSLDPKLFEVFPIGIDKSGVWHNIDLEKLLSTYELNDPLSSLKAAFKNTLEISSLPSVIDVAFPVVHGKIGEDGGIQGLLNTIDIPFVGSDVLSSSICMDKEVAKRLLDFEKIAVAKYLIYLDPLEVDEDEIIEKLGLPVFVKPSNSGSSVGVTLAKTKDELRDQMKAVFEFDHKVVVEESISGLEIECAVLGNENPQASLPARIIPSHEFYSYEAKYIDPEGARFEIPVDLDADIIKEIQNLAVKAYRSLRCNGMARVDFLLSNDGKLYVNEVNTIPGFTSISMYPQMWEVSKLKYKDLLTELIKLGLERKAKDKKLFENVEYVISEGIVS